MKVGDVVNFVSRSWVTDRDYPNPGVVHKVHPPEAGRTRLCKATVLWSDASITKEHACYLEVINGV